MSDDDVIRNRSIARTHNPGCNLMRESLTKQFAPMRQAQEAATCNCHVMLIEQMALAVTFAEETTRNAAILAGNLIMETFPLDDGRLGNGDIKFIAAQFDKLHHAYHELQNTHAKLRDDYSKFIMKAFADDTGITYIIAHSLQGKTITCLTCNTTSHNPHDVENLYCDHCKKFHKQAP